MQHLITTRFTAVLLLGVTILATDQIALAQHDERATVRVDGRAVIRVGPLDGESANERRQRIEQRIERLLEQPDPIDDLLVQQSIANANERLIIVSGVRLVTVALADAEDNFTSVENLAEIWSGSLQDALEMAQKRRHSVGGRFGSEVRGSIESAFGRMLDSAIRLIPRALAALLVLVVFWVLASLNGSTTRPERVRRLVDRWLSSR